MTPPEAAPVRAGLYLTNQQVPGTDQAAALAEQLSFTEQACQGGWDSVFVGEHYLPGDFSQLHPLPYLTRLAAAAGRMRVGIGIALLALHNPVEVADAYATLDVVCEGRLIFGAGLGYRDTEYQAFGVPRGEAVRRLEANLRTVCALWSGEPVDADLPWCRLAGARPATLPLQRPRPPVWMAANNDRAVRRAARLADTWMINPHAALPTVRRQLELFRSARAEAGLPPPAELPLVREVFCAPTREAAIETAAPFLARKYQVYADWGQDKALPGDEDFRRPYADLETDRFIIDSPEGCLARLRPWRELGVSHFIIRTHWAGMPARDVLGSIRLLSEEVLPVLRAG